MDLGVDPNDRLSQVSGNTVGSHRVGAVGHALFKKRVENTHPEPPKPLLRSQKKTLNREHF